MAWMKITDEARPEDGDFVEVQLTNGTTQLAQYTQGKWIAPVAGTATDVAEFSNIIQWRAFAEAKASSRKSVWSTYDHGSGSAAA